MPKPKREHETAPAPAPEASPNALMRRLAHCRLAELMHDAESRRFYGVLGVETIWENGQLTLIRRKIEGTDKRHATDGRGMEAAGSLELPVDHP